MTVLPPTVADRSQRAAALEAVMSAVRASDLALAKRLAVRALNQGFEHPLLLNLRALEFEDAGRFEDALRDLQRAHVLAPKDFAILNGCGLCLARLERPAEALRAYDEALALQPEFGQAWFNRGWALERLGEMALAAHSYGKAVEIHPENAQAWANLAGLAAKRGDRESVRRYAERAIALQPGHPTAVLAIADVELAEPEKAERRLRGLLAAPLGPFDHAVALGQLGDALDKQDRCAEAFASYAKSNQLLAAAAVQFGPGGQATIAETLPWMLRWAEGLEPRPRIPAGEPVGGGGGERAHVFLLGFPRSGTTLIESALGNHPDIVSLEERDTLHASVLEFLGDARALSRLRVTPPAALKRFRDDYWARVRHFGAEPAGKIFIDKNPFNTLKLPLIYELFPDARIIFAVRDPRDVVLSCFRRRFNINASTYEYLDLQRAAANYDQTMRLADLLAAKQPMAVHQLFYERLVEDFTTEAQAVCAFIGADWRDDLIDIAGRARRGGVASASSAQIARGFFSDGVGHWRRYRAELAPVLGVLAPWVARYGYPPD